MDRTQIASTLQDRIPLDKSPIGLAFVDQQPPEVSRIGKAVPSSCAFWREAESSVFYASAEDHYNCSLGAIVMGFELPEAHMGSLMQDVGMMCELTYVREEEVPNVPKVENASSGIVYGPLEQLPMDPDVVLLWVNPMQAMVVSESAGQINWASSPTGVYGRPGCAAIPVALSQQNVAQSFGCTGMRINSGISDEFMLMTVPGDQVESLTDSLAQVTDVHAKMTAHYEQKAATLS